MSVITTVIFDMYDTLVRNDGRKWVATFREIIQSQRLDTDVDKLWQVWRDTDQEFQRTRIQPGAPFQTYRYAWREGFSRSFDTLGVSGDPDAAAAKSIEDLTRREPFPETIRAVEKVQENWRAAILSNADDDFLLPNLERLGLKFEAVLSSEGARSYKPEPGLFLEMARKLKIDPKESVYVGDRQFEDVQGAAGVGMNPVWVNRSNAVRDPRLPKPAYQINNLLELPRLLTEWKTTEDGA